MVSFGANEMIIVLLVIFIIVLLLSVLNPAKSLEESRRNRVKDLIVVGLILWFSPSVKVAGMVVFLYGFGILLYEKYQEGKREALNSR
ncbi:MAG: hypothetical protein GXO67_03990 [Archaeoglobi archaeon]|nr:hypothetical protein [Archaeoglobi archaeon]